MVSVTCDQIAAEEKHHAFDDNLDEDRVKVCGQRLCRKCKPKHQAEQLPWVLFGDFSLGELRHGMPVIGPVKPTWNSNQEYDESHVTALEWQEQEVGHEHATGPGQRPLGMTRRSASVEQLEDISQSFDASVTSMRSGFVKSSM